MTPAERAARLREAARIIGEVVASLDLRENKCTHCERVTFVNWGDHSNGKTLAGLIQKLENMANGILVKAEREAMDCCHFHRSGGSVNGGCSPEEP